MKFLKKIICVFTFCLLFNYSLVNALDIVNPTEYYDFSEMNTIDQDYSFSTLYLTEKTEFSIIKSAGTLSWEKTVSGKELPSFKKIGKNQELILLITNCAVNKEGEVLDVVIKINQVNLFKADGIVQLIVRTNINVLSSQNNPADMISIPLDIGSPMSFSLETGYATCAFTMTYYKTGTYDATNDKGELGNIELVNGFFYDIDSTMNSANYSNQLFEGKEGFRPDVGSSVIYYNKNKKLLSDSNYHVTLQEIDNGIAIDTITGGSDGIWFATSALMLTKDIKNSQYSFTYGGGTCRLDYFFASPYPYGIVEPTKSASVSELTTGESFTYEISQYIPNDYYANLFHFGEIYPNLGGDSKLSEIVIMDTISNSLLVEEKDIVITTEAGEDVTDLFDVTLTNNELVVTAKKGNFATSSFYNHTYTIHVPVTLKSDVKDISSIKNISSVVSKIGEEKEEILYTNEVNVDIKYRLTVNYFVEGTMEKIVDSDIEYHTLNERYATDYNKVTGMWKLVSPPNNASGNIKENTEVNYYFKGVKNPDTGENVKFVIILVIAILVLCLIIRKSKKIYKL